MKTALRSVRFILREGFSNSFRNKLMFIASCAIITAALFILGLFILVVLNIDENIKTLDEKPQIQVYCRYDLSDGEIAELEGMLRQMPGVKEFTTVTREEAFIRAGELLGENSDVLDGIEPDFMPVSFIVKFYEPGQIIEFVLDAEQNPSIEKISYPKKTIDLITGLSKWAKLIGAVFTGIPILFAAVIISNTIRIAVFERRGEIGIMRYIGATERIIRWPFIVEGVVIGVIGASLAFILTGFLYNFVEKEFNSELSRLSGDMLKLMETGRVTSLLIAAYLAIGVGVGSFGSAHSIRKYLKI